jgi:hypothetical protein
MDEGKGEIAVSFIPTIKAKRSGYRRRHFLKNPSRKMVQFETLESGNVLISSFNKE